MFKSFNSLLICLRTTTTKRRRRINVWSFLEYFFNWSNKKQKIMNTPNENPYYPFKVDEMENLFNQINNGKIEFRDVDDKYLEKFPDLITDAFVKKDPKNLKIFNDLQSNVEYAKMAVARNGLTLQYFDEKIKNNESIVLKAVLNKGEALQFAAYKLKNNENIVIAAVRSNPRNIIYASDELVGDTNFIASLMQIDPNVYYQLDYVTIQEEGSFAITPLQNSYVVKSEFLRYSKSGNGLRYMIKNQLLKKEDYELFYMGIRSDYNMSKTYSTFVSVDETMKTKLFELASLDLRRAKNLKVESIFYNILETLLYMNTYFFNMPETIDEDIIESKDKKSKINLKPKRTKTTLEEFLISLLAIEKMEAKDPTYYPFVSKICLSIYSKYVDPYDLRKARKVEIIMKRASKIHDYQNTSKSPKNKKKKKKIDENDDVLDRMVNGTLRHSLKNIKLK